MNRPIKTKGPFKRFWGRCRNALGGIVMPSRFFIYAMGPVPSLIFLWVMWSFLPVSSADFTGPKAIPSAVVLIAVLVFLFLVNYSVYKRGPTSREGPPSDRLLIIVQSHLDQRRDTKKNAYGVAISGEGQPIAYSVELLMKMRQININHGLQVVAGPLLMLDDRHPKAAPPLIQMAREGYVKLYVAKHRIKKHFVADTWGMVYAEKLHKPLQKLRKGWLVTRWEGYSSFYLKRFNKLINGEDPKAIGFKFEDGQALFTTKSVIKRLNEAIEHNKGIDGKTDFNDYTVEDFEELAKKLGLSQKLKQYSQLKTHDWIKERLCRC